MNYKILVVLILANVLVPTWCALGSEQSIRSTAKLSEHLDTSGFIVDSGTWDVYAQGAKGDGKTKDTEAIQKAIDICHSAGGGRVYLHNGKFLSGTIYLKSNVTLHIESGAMLLGSAQVDDYPITSSKYPSYSGDFVTNKMLIYAEDAHNISIIGNGVIDGQGDDFDGPYLFPSFSGRPRIIHFRGCENIQIRDITLKNSGSWVQSYQSCKNMVIDGITVDSRENADIEKPRFYAQRGRNTDGLDLVDCEKVRISNSYINSGDDGICLKSFSPDQACRDITITNCIVTTNASGIKIGTETSGTFEDITITNCTVYDTRIDALSIMTVDGARIERISMSNISLRNIKGSAIFIRQGNRNRPYRKNAEINEPHLRDILFENIQGSGISSNQGCSITGLKTALVENVVLRNINLDFEGGKLADESLRTIPEKEEAYPNGLTFGTLPAYGFYIRHVKNIVLDNVQLSYDKEDQRPAVICENTESLRINSLRAVSSLKTPAMIRLVGSKQVTISNSESVGTGKVFLSVKGQESDDINFLNNRLKGMQHKYVIGDSATKSIVSEFGTIEK